MSALTAAQASAWDRDARERAGVPERVLMENAGRALAAVLHALYPRGPVLGAAGPGHNGGDALVALRVLRSWGRDVAWVAGSERLPELAVLHGDELPHLERDKLNAAVDQAAVIIDGLLGTGSSGPAREPVAGVIADINASGRPVVAVDLPSGVDATSGRVEGSAIHARATVTFGAAKVGLLLHPARIHCGRLLVAEIGFPPPVTPGVAELISPAWAHARLPRRPAHAHKGTAGRVLLLAGSTGMAGAAALAGRAALSAGAGMLRIVSSLENREVLQTLVPEATFHDRVGALPGAGVHALVAGCGIGTDEPALEALGRALDVTDSLPALLDADALNLLAERKDGLARIAARRPVIVTPHLREMARISGLSEADILSDPVGCAHSFAHRENVVVLLKGQPSIVAAPDQPVLINSTGSSDAATGGMGDQ